MHQWTQRAATWSNVEQLDLRGFADLRRKWLTSKGYVFARVTLGDWVSEVQILSPRPKGTAEHRGPFRFFGVKCFRVHP
jgi:hypothetical protein